MASHAHGKHVSVSQCYHHGLTVGAPPPHAPNPPLSLSLSDLARILNRDPEKNADPDPNLLEVVGTAGDRVRRSASAKGESPKPCGTNRPRAGWPRSLTPSRAKSFSRTAAQNIDWVARPRSSSKIMVAFLPRAANLSATYITRQFQTCKSSVESVSVMI